MRSHPRHVILALAAYALATGCSESSSGARPSEATSPSSGSSAGAAAASGSASTAGTAAMPPLAGASGSAGSPAAGSGATGAAGSTAGTGGVSGAAGNGGSSAPDDAGTPLPDAGMPDDAGSAAPDAAPPDAGTASPDSGPPPTTGPLLGVYCGNSPSEVTSFETWLGRPVDGILGYTGDASWEDYDGSVGWAIGVWSELDRRVFWSVPLIPRGATLEAAARGDYDDHYRAAARQLAQYRPQDSEVHIRTGWEFNGDWFPWAARGKASAFVGAFRRFVTAFRAESDRFVFEWNVNVGDVGMNPEEAYPGDDYVDIIGMDFYWNTQWDPAEPNAAWDSMVNRQWGLRWHQEFAAARGKRTSYSEWGVMSNAAGPYIEKAHAWFEQHDVVFQTYWNGNNAFPGKLSDGQYPNAGAAYRAAFGP